MSRDPFDFDDDKTVIQQNKRPGAIPAGGLDNRAPQARVRPNTPQDLPHLGGINPLEKAASRLIPLLITIKNSTNLSDPASLRSKLVNELEDFKRHARDILQDSKQVTQASYVMCTALDEAAMNTPWGHDSNWAQHNLLSTFHNEVFGGERFFTLLKSLGKDPKENIALLELMYLCLSLGYEGNYRIKQDGQNTLLKIRTWLFNIIQNTRAEPESALALNWQGSKIAESSLPKYTPLWVGLAACLAVGSLVYVSLLFKLGSRTNDVVSDLLTSKANPLIVREIAPPVIENPTVASLSELLNTEIIDGDLKVDESQFDRGTILLVGDNLFGSASSSVNDSIAPLINRIGSTLNQYEGIIVVTGHSDNVPIRSAKFPSNLALSQARAESIASLLANSVNSKERLLSEGKGSAEPLEGIDENSPEGRQLNRRVAITVYY